MSRLRILAGASALALLLPLSAFAVDTGSADFTRYVAIGDSITAGFMSGGLFRRPSATAIRSSSTARPPARRPVSSSRWSPRPASRRSSS